MHFVVSARPCVCLSCLYVSNQGAYADNVADAVDQLLILLNFPAIISLNMVNLSILSPCLRVQHQVFAQDKAGALMLVEPCCRTVMVMAD